MSQKNKISLGNNPIGNNFRAPLLVIATAQLILVLDDSIAALPVSIQRGFRRYRSSRYMGEYPDITFIGPAHGEQSAQLQP